MKDRINITVRLAALPPIAMHNVTFAEEEKIRRAEFNINRLWNSWSSEFRDKSAAEVLGMVALQFARLYYSNLDDLDSVDTLLKSFEEDLDKALIDVNFKADASTD